jgi:glycine cleavage system regulatory protein
MTVSLIVTLIGTDRPGLVNTVAERAAACGANWLESSMAQLAGKFAGIVRLEVAEADAAGLESALRGLEAQGLRLNIERAEHAAPADALRVTRMALVGHDRPGIVREISAALARHGASISKLETACESASFSGEPLFRATLEVELPAAVAPASLQAELEKLANELMVDLNLEGQAGN